MASQSPSIPKTDTSQYWVVKREELAFQPFRQGTEIVDPSFSFDLYSGSVVRSFGLVGTKRKIKVDSGETGLIAKDGIRPLSGAEKSAMAAGLASGKPWYSILDTDPEF